MLARAERFDRVTSIPAAPMGERCENLAKSCRRCGSTRYVRTTNPRKRQVVRCAKSACGAPWRRWYTYEAAKGGGGPAHKRTDALDHLVDLGLKLRGLTLWERRVLEAYAQAVNFRGRRTQVTLEHLRAAYPRRRGGWTKATVRGLLDAARAKVIRNLSRRGIFD